MPLHEQPLNAEPGATSFRDDLLNVKVSEEAWNASDVNDLVVKYGGKLRLQIACARVFMMEVPAEEQQFILRDLYDDPRVEWVGLPVTSPVCGVMKFQNVLSGELGSFWDAWRGGVLKRLNVLEAWQDTRGQSSKSGLAPFGHCDLIQVSDLFLNKSWTAWNTALNTGDPAQIFATNVGPDALQYHGFHTGSVAYGNKTTTGLSPYPVGVGPDIQNIVYVRMSMGTNDTSTEDAAALQWAWDHGAKIISISTGWTVDDPVIDAVCQNIYNGGGLVVASAGNEHNANNFYPAHYDYVLNVGGTDFGDGAWGASPQYWGRHMNTQGSSFGPDVDVASIASDIPMGWTLWQRGTSYATPAVAAVCYLISCINPTLTGAQIKEILLSTVDKSHRGWWFYGFFTKPVRSDGVGVGIPDAAKALQKAKTTLSENAGVVFPYLRIHSASRTDQYDGDYSGWQWAPPGTSYRVNADGTADLLVGGKIGWEITGFCSTGPITDVELWIDGVKEYQGPPTDPWVGLLLREEYRNHLWQLKIVARTATGEVGERSYTTAAADATGTLNSVNYVSIGSGPHTLRAQAGGAAATATLVPGNDAVSATGVTQAGALTISGIQTALAKGIATATTQSMAPAGAKSVPAATTSSSAQAITASVRGHMLRAVAGGAPVYASLVPGADALVASAASGAGAVALGAQLPTLPAATGASAAGQLPILSFQAPSAAALASAGLITLAGQRTVPSALATSTTGLLSSGQALALQAASATGAAGNLNLPVFVALLSATAQSLGNQFQVPLSTFVRAAIPSSGSTETGTPTSGSFQKVPETPPGFVRR